MASVEETPVSDQERPERPFCKLCYKPLPYGFEGFHECVSCYYELKRRGAVRPSTRPPSYQTAYHQEFPADDN